MDQVDVVAVVGACAPERALYARRLSEESGRALIPAAHLSRPSAVDALTWAETSADGSATVDVSAGVVVECPATASAIELIGALTDPAAHTRLGAVICVVDAAHLLDDLAAEDFIVTARTPTGQPREFTARALLTVTQLEYASTIVLVNWDVLSTPDLSSVMALVSTLSPRARLRLHVDTIDPISAGPAYAAAQDRAGWVSILNEDAAPHMTDRRVSTLHYQQLRPLHPGRLQRVLDERIEPGEFGLIVRSAGFCRFATRPGETMQWEHVGCTIAFQVLSEHDRLVGIDDHPAAEELMSVGQDLAFIGLDLDLDALTRALDDAALTDAELEAGPTTWARFPDPFPTWSPAENTAD
ncbi:G3E family GTPase [Mycetocola sp. BIGb0189]|uniref:GTP-binding protein n=1 Tax=Mycetocola sp. BIGb0189 TaxID=2940604 RepID=UPI002169C793|nr:GTP-binding protein [Mycetocola sp. BIGb0189]MCS4277560.1 G3E family GTPase [Mycetocola sp. BIGb0189]